MFYLLQAVISLLCAPLVGAAALELLAAAAEPATRRGAQGAREGARTARRVASLPAGPQLPRGGGRCGLLNGDHGRLNCDGQRAASPGVG